MDGGLAFDCRQKIRMDRSWGSPTGAPAGQGAYHAVAFVFFGDAILISGLDVLQILADKNKPGAALTILHLPLCSCNEQRPDSNPK